MSRAAVPRAAVHVEDYKPNAQHRANTHTTARRRVRAEGSEYVQRGANDEHGIGVGPTAAAASTDAVGTEPPPFLSVRATKQHHSVAEGAVARACACASALRGDAPARIACSAVAGTSFRPRVFTCAKQTNNVGSAAQTGKQHATRAGRQTGAVASTRACTQAQWWGVAHQIAPSAMLGMANRILSLAS